MWYEWRIYWYLHLNRDITPPPVHPSYVLFLTYLFSTESEIDLSKCHHIPESMVNCFCQDIEFVLVRIRSFSSFDDLWWHCTSQRTAIFFRDVSMNKTKSRSMRWLWSPRLRPRVTLHFQVISWCCHQMETFSALLAICAGNSPAPGEFPAQRPVTRSFDIFFDLRLNKQLNKQSRGWWFETLSRSLWRHCNVMSPNFDDLTRWDRSKTPNITDCQWLGYFETHCSEECV